ncbi:MAG: PEP-CTERM system histidine kinase PrsK, partial [Deltaproteobacteria bacterium]
MPTLFHYLTLVNALFCLGIGLYVLSRNHAKWANIGFFVGMAALGLTEFGSFMGASADPGNYSSWYDKLYGAGMILLPGSWFLFGVSFARAEASGFLKRWRSVLYPIVAFSALLLLLTATGSAVAEEVTSKGTGYWVSVFLVLSLTVTLANFESTLRSADPAQRRKIKFILLGIGSILVFQIYAHSQHLLFPRMENDLSAIQSTVLFIACLLIVFSLVRHQLMDVDVFVSRDFVYNTFTVGAVGFYLIVVGLTGQAIRSFGGIPALYLKSLFVFLTVLFLVAVLLSHNIQKKVKTFIERNFYRHRYDYHTEWEALTDQLGSKLEPRELLPAIAQTFLHTMWIENTFLWLYDDREKDFKLVEMPQDVKTAPVRWEPDFVSALKDRDYPVNLEQLTELPAGADIGDGQKRLLREMGVQVLSPMIAGNQFVGILGLSGSFSAYPLDHEDYDLIKTVSKQAASCFLNARLSRNLVLAKEMETFHAFSAFVMHDLKNFVSMLSLVVQNAERNFGDPEFRADALASISQTTEKMKRMMDRLAVLSRKLELECTVADLNDVARDALSGLNGALGSRIVGEFGKIPAVAIDPIQMKKVVTNLVLNAEEAMAAKG